MSRRFLTVLAVVLGPLAASAFRVELATISPEMKAVLLREDPALLDKDLSAAEVDGLLKRAHGLPGVERVVANDLGDDRLRIEIQLFRRIGKVKFTGLKALSDSSARTAFGLSSGEAFEMNSLVDAAERLRTAYREIGVLNPVFDVETPEEHPGTVDLLVKVTENAISHIESWTVQSPDPELNKKYEKWLNAKASGRYTDATIQKAQDYLRADLRAARRLRAEVGSPEARFSADESRVDMTVKLDKIDAYIVTFRGNREFSSDKLEDDILDLRDFTTANPNVTSELAEKIRQAYLARGYARVDVTSSESDGRTPFTRRIQFDIDEGPQVRIEKIEVKGHFSRKESYYAKLIADSSSKQVRAGFYIKDDLENGFKKLVLELQNEGYLLAKIVSTRTQYARDGSRITVYVNLDEGPMTIVDGIVFEGNQQIPSAELLPLLDLRIGGPLQLDQIERSAQLIRQHYQDNGYIEMQILNEKDPDLVAYSENNTRAKLIFKIQEGPQVRVASIMLDGNSFTRDQVILNELDFEVGDLLTPAKIDDSTARLQRTGYFGNVEIRTLEEKTSVANRTVIVRVTERNPGVFTIGAGATNEDDFTLRGYTGIAYNNIMGTGRGISSRFEGNYNVAHTRIFETKVTVGYLEPYLFNTRNRGRVNLSRTRGINQNDPSRNLITEENKVVYSAEREFTSHVIGTWDVWSLATYNDTYRDGALPNSNLDIAMTTLHLDLDYRDNPFNPTHGTFSRFAADYSSPKIGSLNCDEFWRAFASFNFYLPVPGTHVTWANSLQARYLKSLSGGLDGGVSYDKVGFRLGGRSTVRGFEGSSEEFPSTSIIDTNYKLLTSATSSLLKTELRIPLWWENVDGVVFYDGGAVTIEGVDLGDVYRDSAGFGVHYNTPVGPVSLEFAWKLDRKAGEQPWQFHLSVGTF